MSPAPDPCTGGYVDLSVFLELSSIPMIDDRCFCLGLPHRTGSVSECASGPKTELVILGPFGGTP